MPDDIIQEIDNQLEAGEQYISEEQCPHCCWPWHGLPLTARILEMFGKGEYDENYRVDTDDSPVVCPGSDFIGPIANWSLMGIVEEALDLRDQQIDEAFAARLHQINEGLDEEIAALDRKIARMDKILVWAWWANIIGNAIVITVYLVAPSRFPAMAIINLGCLLFAVKQLIKDRRKRKARDLDEPGSDLPM
jgi:hypothetical protein